MPAPDDEDKTSWRFSFSVAEVELSKLVPETARKCLLAMKIILKDHLQPVVPEIGSYHIKTIFLNSLEKFPVGFWVKENIEECLLTLLTELRDSFVSMKCSHHCFSFVNLFDIDGKKLQILTRKIEKIMKGPHHSSSTTDAVAFHHVACAYRNTTSLAEAVSSLLPTMRKLPSLSTET